MMNRTFLLASVAGLGLCASTQAFAQTAVVCTNCSTLVEQGLQYIQEFANQINTFDIDVQEIANTIKLPGTVYRDLTGDIQMLEGLRMQADLLTSQFSGPIIQNLSSTSGYPGMYGGINWHQQFTSEANAVALALKTAGTTLQVQVTQLAADANTLAALANQAFGASGRQQTLQTAAGTASAAAQSMQKLQSVMSNDHQAMMTKIAADADHQYLSQSVSDADLEINWVTECHAIAADGWPQPTFCAGAN